MSLNNNTHTPKSLTCHHHHRRRHHLLLKGALDDALLEPNSLKTQKKKLFKKNWATLYNANCN
jgi:hypothetical protein